MSTFPSLNEEPTNLTAQEHEVLRRFDTFKVTDEERSRMHGVRLVFKHVAREILGDTKPGREQSLALTALEEAKYWTNQSIAKDGVPA